MVSRLHTCPQRSKYPTRDLLQVLQNFAKLVCSSTIIDTSASQYSLRCMILRLTGRCGHHGLQHLQPRNSLASSSRISSIQYLVSSIYLSSIYYLWVFSSGCTRRQETTPASPSPALPGDSWPGCGPWESYALLAAQTTALSNITYMSALPYLGPGGFFF